ncbi:MAG: hypothetical protein PHX83_15520 [Acidobacteriia bacterium]|nr:hypothetical protein [Terriglobia bacterium]
MNRSYKGRTRAAAPVVSADMNLPSKGGTRRFGWLFLGICLVYFLTLTDTRFYRIGDGQMMFDTAVSLREFGELGIARFEKSDPYNAMRKEYYSRYGLGTSVVEAVTLVIAPVVEKMFGEGRSNILFPLMNLLITALAALGVAGCVQEMGAGFRTCALAMIGFALCTPAWPYTSLDFSEPLQSLCVVGALWFVLRGTRGQSGNTRWLTFAGLALGYAVFTKAVLICLIPGYTLYVWLRMQGRIQGRVRALSGYFISLGVCAFVMMALNWYRFGSLVRVGYETGTFEFSTPLLTGLYGQLLSPTKGLIFYAPLTILLPWALWKMWPSHWRELILFAAVIIPYAVLNAKWWSWEGGASWGPRLIVPIIPFLVILIAAVWEESRWGTGLFFLCSSAGLVVNLLAVMLYFLVYLNLIFLNPIFFALDVEGRPKHEYIERDGQKLFRPDIASNYVPALSPLRGQVWLLGARCFGRPFSLQFLKPGSGVPPPTVKFPPIEIDFSLLHDAYTSSQLQSAHLWWWDLLTPKRREVFYSYPFYGISMERQGERAVEKKDLDRAVYCYRKSAELIPNYVRPCLELSSVEWEKGDRLQAVQDLLRYFEQPVKKEDEERAARLQLGQYYESLGNIDAAVEQFEIYMTLHPTAANRESMRKEIQDLKVHPPK